MQLPYEALVGLYDVIAGKIEADPNALQGDKTLRGAAIYACVGLDRLFLQEEVSTDTALALAWLADDWGRFMTRAKATVQAAGTK